jgi:hypothetical protein
VALGADDSVEAMMGLDENVVETATMLAASHPDVDVQAALAGQFHACRGRAFPGRNIIRFRAGRMVLEGRSNSVT